MSKLGPQPKQRWRRMGPGFSSGYNQQIFIVEIIEILRPGSVRARIVQDSSDPGSERIRDCHGLPEDTDSNVYWALLEGQDAPC